MMKTKRNLAIFIAVSLLCGWLGVLLDAVLSEQPEGDTLGMGAWLVLPLLTAIVLSIISRDWKETGLTPKFKGNIKWYILSLAVFPAIAILTLVLARFFDIVDFSGIGFNEIAPLIAAALLINIIKNVFEEFAWRGYLTSGLLALKINDWPVFIISGLVWAFWHLPYYLVFLDESIFESLAVSRIEFAFTATFTILCWNVLYVEMFRLTKSVWPCAVMHAAEDAVPAFLFTGGYYVFTSNAGAWVFDPHIGMVAAVLPLGIGLLIRRIRKNSARVMGLREARP